MNGIQTALEFVIDFLAKLLKGIPQIFGIDEWYIFYIGLGIIFLLVALIRKKV